MFFLTAVLRWQPWRYERRAAADRPAAHSLRMGAWLAPTLGLAGWGFSVFVRAVLLLRRVSVAAGPVRVSSRVGGGAASTKVMVRGSNPGAVARRACSRPSAVS